MSTDSCWSTGNSYQLWA